MTLTKKQKFWNHGPGMVLGLLMMLAVMLLTLVFGEDNVFAVFDWIASFFEVSK